MKKYFTTRLRVVLVLAVLAALITIGSMFLWPGKAGAEQCGICGAQPRKKRRYAAGG